MDDYVEQNDISDDVSYDESSDVLIDDSDALETDDIIDGVEVDESIESFDDTTEENAEVEEDSIHIETDESEYNIDDIPEDTITEDEALEEGTEEFLEDVVTENESASEDEQEEILEDTFTEEELSLENEQEEILEDSVDEENLVADSSSDNCEHFASEDLDEIPHGKSVDNENLSSDGSEETIIFETEIEEPTSDLEEDENSVEVNGEEESNNENAESDSVDAAIEEENIDESETIDFQNDIEQIEAIDDAISETMNSETVELDAELENSEDSDATTDETDELQYADSDDDGESNESFDADEVSTDENNDTDSDVEIVNEQDVDADEISLEESDIPDVRDTGNVDISQDIDSVEVDTDTADVNDSSNSEQGLRDRVIHPSFGQTIKIAKNMGDTLKADDEGFQTVKGYRVGKASQFLNSVASTIAQTAPGQSIVDKSLLSDASHVFDARHATMHPEEKFDFRTPSDVSAEEKAAHTLEVEMPSISYNIDEKALENIDSQDSVLDSEGYKERIDVTPINKGSWLNENGLEGIRGESKWCPNDTNVQQELNKFGINGIEYKNGYPDFTSVSFFGCNLEESEFLDSDRTQFDGCNFTLLNEIEADPEFAKLYNFDDEQLEDLENGKTPYGYTWHHDTSEKGFMLLVPTSIHQACRHSGGRSSWGGGSKNR